MKKKTRWRQLRRERFRINGGARKYRVRSQPSYRSWAKETRIVVGRLSAAEQEGDGKEGKRETLREEMREQREVVASFRHPLENREYRGAKSLYLG